MEFTELKQLIKESIDESDNLPDLLMNVAEKIYQKGGKDAVGIKDEQVWIFEEDITNKTSYEKGAIDGARDGQRREAEK